MAKSTDLVFRDFQKGIAISPHFGYGDMRNLDIYSSPGAVRINYSSSKTTGSLVTDLPKWIVRDPASGNLYALGDTGKVYVSSNNATSWSILAGNTTTSANGNGLALWKDHLIVARNSSLDVYGPISGAAAWSNGWQSVTSSPFHPMQVGQDDILYIGNDRYIASIQERTGSTFAPGTPASYLYTAQALDLPAGYKVKCLAELGSNLMIGTWMGTNIFDNKVADIFTWDRASDSFTLPIRLSENGINQMITVGNLLYVVAGTKHSVYVTNGATTSLLRKLPDAVTNIGFTSGTYLDPYPGAIAFHQGRIYTGVSSGTQSSILDGFGVWSVDPNNGSLVFENQISTGTTDATNNIRIGALLSITNDTYLIGWQDNTSYGIDLVGGNYYGDYEAYFDSPLTQVGLPLNKRTFTQIEVQFARPLAAGQGARLRYRTGLGMAWSDPIATFDFSTYGAVTGVSGDAKITDAQFLQIRCELDSGAASPELRHVILR